MSNSAQAANIERKEIMGHPTGLFILFFTEMWERFSYYGMRAILTLYIYSSATADNPGLGWKYSDAIWLYGWYTMLVYVMSIPGGIIADKWLGQKKTVMFGGLILCAGHGILAIEALWAFYLGLLLIVIGVGGLKPNISTMVGGLYPKGDPRRDSGFTIFYIGINIGALLAAIIVGYVGETIGWHYGFGLAGIGMLLGQVVYMLGQKHLKGVGEAPKNQVKTADETKDSSIGGLFSNLLKSPMHLSITGILMVVGLGASYFFIEGVDSYAYAVLFIFLALTAGIMMMIYKEINTIDKDRFIVLLISFLIVIVFWGAFEQAGGLMNIYTKEKVDRFIGGFEIPASWFQSVNAAFIIIFGGIVAWFWSKMRKANKESSSLYKMALGTIIMGAGFLFMVGASNEAGSEAYGKASLYWIILAYLLHTIGELCASPVALSFITKLAPVKYVSLMMGAYFAATGLGNKLAGVIGEAATTEPVTMELIAPKNEVITYNVDKKVINEDKNFEIKADVYLESDEVVIETPDAQKDLIHLFEIKKESKTKIKEILEEGSVDKEGRYHATLKFEKDKDSDEAKGNGKDYSATLVIEEVQNAQEKKIFFFIFFFTLTFGVLLLIFLKKLKKLTHGADEDGSGQEPYPDDEYSVNPEAQE